MAEESAVPEGPPQCAHAVPSFFGGVQRCSRRGYALSADGKHYCKQHHPETRAQRRQEKDRRWKAEMEARDAAIAEAEAQARTLGIGEPSAGPDGDLVLTRAEAAVLRAFLVEGDPAIRDAWRRRLVTFNVERSRT